MTLPEDTILENRYRIDSLLVHGGMGAVYRGFDTHLSMPVAIKETFIEPPQVAQFRQEALLLARLRHPALPRVMQHFGFEGQQYLVMDFVEGEDLAEIIRRGGPLTEREALEIILQLCPAVHLLHRQKPPLFHRDIKPKNIKITPEGRAVLVDFGIAKPLVAPAETSSPGPAADIYALGATLYTALTGRQVPPGLNPLAGPSKLEPSPQLTPPLGQAVLQAVQAKTPTVAEWQSQLENILAQLPAVAPVKGDTPNPSTRKEAPPAEVPTAPAEEGRAEAGFWLVDSRGVGYPLSGPPVSLGRGVEADIPINEGNVSRLHVLVRVEANRCYVQDQNSANGTFLNGYRLGPDWYPLNSGDALVVGSARFFLTVTRPARLAPPKPVPVALPVMPPLATDQMPPAPPPPVNPPPPAPVPTRAKKSVGRWVGGLAIALVLMAALLAAVAAGYFSRHPDQLAALWGNPAPTATLPALATAAATTTSTPTVAVVVAPIASPSPSPAASPSSQPSATPTQLVAASPTLTATAAAKTPTRTSGPTALPTSAGAVKPSPTPGPSGPTVIPLKVSVTVPQLGRREVIDVDFNPQNPREVYAVVKRDGIYKSVNGGDGPWGRVDLDGSSLTGLAIDPNQPSRLYAPTWNAVLKSTDGGNTWEAKTNGLMANRAVDLVVVHPANSSILLAGVGEKMVGSVDGGESWDAQMYGNGLGVARLTGIVVDPFNPQGVYVTGPAAAIYKSENGGQNFYPLPYNVGEGSYGLAAHPARQNVLLAGINSGQAAMVKTENGVDFRSVSGGLIYGGADSAYCAVVYAPSDPNVVYAGSGFESDPDAKGVFKSTDGGESWQNISSGLAVNPNTGFPYYVKSMAVHPLDPNTVLAATGSGLYKTTDGGQNWTLQ